MIELLEPSFEAGEQPRDRQRRRMGSLWELAEALSGVYPSKRMRPLSSKTSLSASDSCIRLKVLGG